MCGIIGIISKKPVAPLLLAGLKRLEYRGYDSAGIATLETDHLRCLRAAGKLHHLEKKYEETPIGGFAGIGHTRWATHGKACERNAHPHMNGTVAVVHNGIIENFGTLRAALETSGCIFESETDTETIVHLLSLALKAGKTPLEAVRGTLKQLRGAFAFVALFANYGDTMIAARSGPPLVLGMGEGEMFVGSDSLALAPFTRKICYLEDGDYALIHKAGAVIYNADDQEVERKITHCTTAQVQVSKENYHCFMEKEIFEQPDAVAQTLAHYVDLEARQLRSISQAIDWNGIKRLVFSGCGTAYYAASIARYWFESLAMLGVDIDVASEFRYREPPLDLESVAFFVSQSGETADSLASMRYCRDRGVEVAALVNVLESSMAREANHVFPILAGPEIGVASTKAFTCQLVSLALLSLEAAKARGRLTGEEEQNLLFQLLKVPSYLHKVLQLDAEIIRFCSPLIEARSVLYLGRGPSFPLALEGALKLKELSYLHAEAYAAGELKHGPIALIDSQMPIVVVAPFDKWFEKTMSNMREAAARGGKILLITDENGAKSHGVDGVDSLILPSIPTFISPILYAVPLQLVAYHVARILGRDIDQPRNLAKSVTVE